MNFIRPADFPFSADRKNFVPICKQSIYKYLVYVDGHCAASRYSILMRLGSVILKVQSHQVADQLWYFPLLKPYQDHIPVKADLSDLAEKIEWCREHDEECRQIVENCQQIYTKYVARDGLLDYVQVCLKHVAAHQADA
jgi:Glycosyl transferase family 90